MTTESASTNETLVEVLERYWGYTSFRPLPEVWAGAAVWRLIARILSTHGPNVSYSHDEYGFTLTGLDGRVVPYAHPGAARAMHAGVRFSF